jgi:hypothetical protein
LGLAKSPVNVCYIIPKQSFEPGDDVKVMIDCDNSATRLNVDAFKVKLFRRIETSVELFGFNHIALVNTFQFDKNGRFDGCPAR